MMNTIRKSALPAIILVYASGSLFDLPRERKPFIVYAGAGLRRRRLLSPIIGIIAVCFLPLATLR
jgi:hypothetical protein